MGGEKIDDSSLDAATGFVFSELLTKESKSSSELAVMWKQYKL